MVVEAVEKDFAGFFDRDICIFGITRGFIMVAADKVWTLHMVYSSISCRHHCHQRRRPSPLTRSTMICTLEMKPTPFPRYHEAEESGYGCSFWYTAVYLGHTKKGGRCGLSPGKFCHAWDDIRVSEKRQRLESNYRVLDCVSILCSLLASPSSRSRSTRSTRTESSGPKSPWYAPHPLLFAGRS